MRLSHACNMMTLKLNHETGQGKVRGATTYSRKFTIDVLDQEGAEFGENLEACWFLFIRIAEAHLRRILPESRAGCKTCLSLDICQISRVE